MWKIVKIYQIKKNALIPLFYADTRLAKVQGHYTCTCNHQSAEYCFYSRGFQTLLASWKAAEALKTENIFAYVSLKPFATVKIPIDPEGWTREVWWFQDEHLIWRQLNCDYYEDNQWTEQTSPLHHRVYIIFPQETAMKMSLKDTKREQGLRVISTAGKG